MSTLDPSQWTATTSQTANSVLVGGLPYMVQNAQRAYSFTSPSAGTLRFEVQSGDVWALDPASRERSEIAGVTQYGFDTQINISYGFKIEPGAANTGWLVVGQLHQTENTAAAPPVEITMIGERMAVVVNTDGPGGTVLSSTIWEDTQNIVRGQNYNMQIQATVDAHGMGHLDVIRDGVTLIDYTGSIGYAATSGVYWKEGVYRGASSTDIAVDYSNLSVTTSAASLHAATFVPTVSFTQSLDYDTGVVGDNLTKVGWVTLAGHATPGSVLTLSDGAKVLMTTAVNGLGNWNYHADLGAGAHSLSATVVYAGVSSAPATGASFVVDNTAPNLPVITGISPDTGASSTDGVTKANALIINGSAEANSQVLVYIDGKARAWVTADSTGKWTLDNRSQILADGNHTITATATDAADNISAMSSAFTVSVQTAALPAPTVNSYAATSSTMTLGGSGVATIALSEHGVIEAATSANSGVWTTSLADSNSATHAVTVTESDLAGRSAVTHVVTGTAGADTLTAISAGDQLIGNGGGDTYVLSTSTANGTTIWSFTSGQDKLQLNGFSPALTKVAQVDATHYSITDGSHSATVQFLQTTPITSGDLFFYTNGRYYLGASALPTPYVSSYGQSNGSMTIAGFAATDVNIVENGLTIATAARNTTTSAWSATFGSDASKAHSYEVLANSPKGQSEPMHLLTGTSGADTLTGVEAGDILVGKGGGDTYVLNSVTANNAQIVGFVSGREHLVFEGFDHSAGVTQIDTTHWKVADGTHSEIFTINSGTVLQSGDYSFDQSIAAFGFTSVNESGTTLTLSGNTTASSISVSEGGQVLATVASSGGSANVSLTSSAAVAHTYTVAAGNAFSEHVVVGTAGADVLKAQSAGDYLLGNGGGDTFVLGVSNANNTHIAAFTSGSDHLEFVGFNQWQSSVTQVDSNHWRVADAVHSAVFEIDNGPHLTSADYYFG